MSIDPIELEIQAFVDGELDEAARADLARRLEADPELQARVAAEEKLQGLFAEIRSESRPSLGLASRVLVGLRERGPERRSGPSLWARAAGHPAAAAAAILLLVGASFFVGRQSTQAAPESLRAELESRRAAILAEHPGIDRAELERLYGDFWSRLEGLDADRRRYLSELESRIEALIQKTGAPR